MFKKKEFCNELIETSIRGDVRCAEKKPCKRHGEVEPSWEKEFEKLWGGYPANKKQNIQGLDSLIKDFIHNLLQKRDKDHEILVNTLLDEIRRLNFWNRLTK